MNLEGARPGLLSLHGFVSVFTRVLNVTQQEGLILEIGGDAPRETVGLVPGSAHLAPSQGLAT